MCCNVPQVLCAGAEVAVLPYNSSTREGNEQRQVAQECVCVEVLPLSPGGDSIASLTLAPG